MMEALVYSTREVCGCTEVGSKNINSELWYDKVKQAVKSKKRMCLKPMGLFSKEKCM